MSIIIVEGPDCSGKSTFVAELQKQAPTAEVLKTGVPEPDADPYDEYERRLYPYLQRNTRHVICDRWAWGEKIYGPLLRNTDRLGTAGWRHVELFLAAQGATVVYMHQPSTVLIDRLQTRGDDWIKPRDLAEIERGYQWCLRNTILPVIGLRDPDWFYAIQLTKYNPGAGLLADYTSYIGSIRPSGLLFGEARKRGDESEDLSAFVPRSATSGRYLLESLPEDTWPHLGIANAMEEDVEDLWMELDEVPVIALGLQAHRKLDEHKIPHATVPHPQFVRRFLYKHQIAYGNLIRNLMGTHVDQLHWRG